MTETKVMMLDKNKEFTDTDINKKNIKMKSKSKYTAMALALGAMTTTTNDDYKLINDMRDDYMVYDSLKYFSGSSPIYMPTRSQKIKSKILRKRLGR